MRRSETGAVGTLNLNVLTWHVLIISSKISTYACAAAKLPILLCKVASSGSIYRYLKLNRPFNREIRGERQSYGLLTIPKHILFTQA